MADDRNGGAFILGAVLGAIASASATLWLTPRSGEEVREDLARRARALEQQAREAVEQVPVLSDIAAKIGGEPVAYGDEMAPPSPPQTPPVPDVSPAEEAVVVPSAPAPTEVTTEQAPAATSERPDREEPPAGTS